MVAGSKRRDRGDGALFQDGTTGRWVGRLIVDGQRRKVTGRTKAEAKSRLDALRRDVADGRAATAGDLTVAALLDEWARKALPNRSLEPQTITRHHETIRALKVDLGSRRVRDLTPDIIEAAFEQRAENGAARATLAKHRTTLSLALAWAVRRRKVGWNVAPTVELPASARPTQRGRTMSVEQARALLAAAEGTPLGAMWTVMVYLGLRPGEAAGLSWSDVDIDEPGDARIHVRRARKTDGRGRAFVGSTKNDHSVRSLDVPEAVVAALRAHRALQARQQLASGGTWANPDNLVFTSPTGRPLDPSNARRAFATVREAAGLDSSWTPNQLRHTAASLMADAGVPIEEVADQLGHRDTRMASLHYRHRIKPTVSGGNVLGDVLGQK